MVFIGNDKRVKMSECPKCEIEDVVTVVKKE